MTGSFVFDFSIIASTSIWIYDWFGWKRQQFAWVSKIDNIKWNNLGIVNPVKHQGMKKYSGCCNNKIIIIFFVIFLHAGSMVQLRGILLHISFPNYEKLLGYYIFLNNTNIEYKEISGGGQESCGFMGKKEECIASINTNSRIEHNIIPIPYSKVQGEKWFQKNWAKKKNALQA